jgi:hypothetical protein
MAHALEDAPQGAAIEFFVVNDDDVKSTQWILLRSAEKRGANRIVVSQSDPFNPAWAQGSSCSSVPDPGPMQLP